MTDRCPGCGADFELDERAVTVRAGSCPGCHRSFTFLPVGETTLIQGAGPSAPAPSPRGAAAPLALGPSCDDCGEALLFAVSEGPDLEGTCPKCGASSRFVPESAAPEAPGPEDEEDEEEDDEGAPERELRAPRRGAAAPRDSGFAPRARPCRRCGGPLRFSTGDDGLVTGECDSCGNRFTLPPRAGGPGGSRPFSRGFSGRPGARGGRRFPPRGGGRGGPGFRPRGRAPPRFRDRGDDEGSDERPRRRRPRRDE